MRNASCLTGNGRRSITDQRHTLKKSKIPSAQANHCALGTKNALNKMKAVVDMKLGTLEGYTINPYYRKPRLQIRSK
jgi:hypothetical protein